MAWIHKGRKYWYHNGKRYSCKFRKKTRQQFLKEYSIKRKKYKALDDMFFKDHIIDFDLYVKLQKQI